jgi:hypothetical protein
MGQNNRSSSYKVGGLLLPALNAHLRSQRICNHRSERPGVPKEMVQPVQIRNGINGREAWAWLVEDPVEKFRTS